MEQEIVLKKQTPPTPNWTLGKFYYFQLSHGRTKQIQQYILHCACLNLSQWLSESLRLTINDYFALIKIMIMYNTITIFTINYNTYID